MDHPKRVLDLCRCFQHAVNEFCKRGQDSSRLVLQIIPLRLLLDASMSCHDHRAVCKSVAFTTYTRVFRRVGPTPDKVT
jgi:hypothetical protein